jgi:hypothetical protein
MQKFSNHKSFNYLVWTPLGSRVNLYIHFSIQVHFKVSAAITLGKLVAKFAAGVVDTGGKP